MNEANKREIIFLATFQMSYPSDSTVYTKVGAVDVSLPHQVQKCLIFILEIYLGRVGRKEGGEKSEGEKVSSGWKQMGACQVRNAKVLFWFQSGTSKQNEEAFQRGYTLLFD